MTIQWPFNDHSMTIQWPWEMAHLAWWFTYEKWWFSMAMLNNQMVYIYIYLSHHDFQAMDIISPHYMAMNQDL